MAKDCLFCKIIKGEVPVDKVYEDESIIVFHDISPQAPVHVLIVPKVHIASLDDVKTMHMETVGWMVNKVKDIAKELELDNGYRIVCNTGSDAMQTVNHLHFHLLGKRQMTWPPG